MTQRKTIKIDVLGVLRPVYDQASLLSNLRYYIPEQVLQMFDFVWTPHRPDYYIASESVFRHDNYLGLLKKGVRHDTVLIFLSGESVLPDLNIFDYAFVFDRNMTLGDRVCRMPPPLAAIGLEYSKMLNEKLHSLPFLSRETKKGLTFPIENPQALLAQKTGFCNFIYSNSKAHPNRDKLFNNISAYKQVDSLGRHLNNKKHEIPQGTKNWCDNSIAMKKPYKFSIACENASYRGYVSEKIVTSFCAKTIPIYWGDPTIVEDFNPKAFINCHDYANVDEVLERVKQIDQNDDLWLSMIQEPCSTSEQVAKHEREMEAVCEFARTIFSQDKAKAKRVADGTWPAKYRRRFFQTATHPLLLTLQRCHYQVLSKIASGKTKQRYIKKYTELNRG